MILIIDNYDSFVFNLARYVEELGYIVKVVRNNELTLNDIEQIKPSAIIISPGPCGPQEAGISIEVVSQLAGKIPILGICLGHQVIGHVFGSKILRAQKPLHGQSCLIYHNESGIFAGVASPLKVGRYHSLIVDETVLSKELTVTSRSSENEVMSIESKTMPLVGLQFHPESILTEHGHLLIHNFLRDVAADRGMNINILKTIKSRIPNAIYDWLTKPQNLTETLKKTGVKFSLKVLSQRIEKIYTDEQIMLDLHEDQALLRKVILCGNNRKMIFARVAIPKSTYRHYQIEFDTLGNAPIGNTLLYNNETVTRSDFVYTLLNKTHPILKELKQNMGINDSHQYWMRQSIFTFPKGSLLISEVFLHNISSISKGLFDNQCLT